MDDLLDDLDDFLVDEDDEEEEEKKPAPKKSKSKSKKIEVVDEDDDFLDDDEEVKAEPADVIPESVDPDDDSWFDDDEEEEEKAEVKEEPKPEHKPKQKRKRRTKKEIEEEKAAKEVEEKKEDAVEEVKEEKPKEKAKPYFTNRKEKYFAPDEKDCDGISLEDDVLHQINISEDLVTEYNRQPSLYAYWSVQNARALNELRKLSDRKEMVWYGLYNDYRANNEKAKENECKAYVINHLDYQEVLNDYNESEYRSNVFKAAVKSFEMRSAMLMQLGAQNRQEMGMAGMTLKEAADNAANIIKQKTSNRFKGE